MAPVTAQDTAAMDDTAAWGASNVVVLPAGRITAHNVDQCYTALQQSLAHYRNAGRMTDAQLRRQRHLLRAEFLKAEAAEMFGEQWEAYAIECYSDDGYRASRGKADDVSAAMDAWAIWDAEGRKLYDQLLHRANCAKIDAKNA